MGIKVYHKHGEKIETTLRKFKKLCEREGIIREMKKHAYYEKPSERKARELRQAKKRAAEKLLENS